VGIRLLLQLQHLKDVYLKVAAGAEARPPSRHGLAASLLVNILDSTLSDGLDFEDLAEERGLLTAVVDRVHAISSTFSERLEMREKGLVSRLRTSVAVCI
jgi:hypothetical protein